MSDSFLLASSGNRLCVGVCPFDMGKSCPVEKSQSDQAGNWCEAKA